MLQLRYIHRVSTEEAKTVEPAESPCSPSAVRTKFAAEVINPIDIRQLFTFIKLLGKGGNGCVYQVTSKISAKSYACKVLAKKNAAGQRLNSRKLKNEIELSATFSHPNLIKFRDAFESPKYYFILMDHASGGELYNILSAHGAFSSLAAARVISAALQAICYLHDNLVIHRDLKLENILLDGVTDKDVTDGNIPSSAVKVIDLGLAKRISCMEHRSFTTCGSEYYLAPELCIGFGYSLPVDVWGAGVILFMLLTNTPPFYKTKKRSTRQSIIQGEFTFPEKLQDENAKRLIEDMMRRNPSRRIPAREALSHSWFKELQI